MMTTQFILKSRRWFETLSFRERILTMLLLWAVIYGVLYFLLFRSIEIKQEAITLEVKELRNNVTNWNSQIESLNKIVASPTYKQWLKQTQSSYNLRGKYKELLQTSDHQWRDIIKTILSTQTNVKLAQIQNTPETAYTPTGAVNNATNLYQQKMSVVLYSDYFDTMNYLQKLEITLPNIRWDSITYEVQKYPIGKVQMEFSIFYEKTK